MLKDMKYIVVVVDGIEMPVLFPWLMTHASMSLRFSGHTVSAGFVAFDDGKLLAYGESVGLDLESREEDTQLINNFFKNKE